MIVLCNSIVKITDLTTFASVRYVSKLLFSDLVDVLVSWSYQIKLSAFVV